MDNFDLKKFLIENKLVPSSLKEQDDNFNVDSSRDWEILEGSEFIEFIEENKDKIAQLNDDYAEVIEDNDVNLLDKSYWANEEDFKEFVGPEYDYSYEQFMNDWKRYDPTIVMLGEELMTVFVSNIDLPYPFGNVVSGNTYGFFGTIAKTSSPFKEYKIGDVKIYIVWGIPDPGS